MEIQREYPNVHWIWRGGISFVYEVDPHIVVKVPQNGDFEKDQFKKELEIYKTFSQNPPCPSIVQCFYYTDNGIFLEYMRDGTLCERIHAHQMRDEKTRTVTQVTKLEPLALRKEWMNALAQAVTFLESLNLAHGDLRPPNILLNGDTLKLSDFDATAEIGTHFECCLAPYGRLLNKHEADLGPCGSAGDMGPRTETFALGSLFFFINYGFEVYEDRCLDEDPKEHGPRVVDLLQDMVLPELDGDPVVDEVIRACWFNQFARVADLAAHTQTLVTVVQASGGTQVGELSDCEYGDGKHGALKEGDGEQNDGQPNAGEGGGEQKGQHVNKNPHNGGDGDTETSAAEEFGEHTGEQNDSEPDGNQEAAGGNDDYNGHGEDLCSKRALCRDLEQRGLLEILSSAEPEQLGFSLEWYRHRPTA
ncbi:protein kinase [Aspergillus pseudodeflectus]|uniref:Protein kinase n=1 Tax=Aspergillus pseudodeflectus TaxID=176178 RepID=A0ABR4L3X0_9EURO